MVRSGATSSDGAEGVRCGAVCSGGAMVVLAWAKTSWAYRMMMDPCQKIASSCDCSRQTANIYIVAQQGLS